MTIIIIRQNGKITTTTTHTLKGDRAFKLTWEALEQQTDMDQSPL